ncbi:MAG TPA: trypsin-like peptidase domain-containing protein [Verrucomicrobiae bacterium]|jgi:serine protease Do|nr:trypsin-like peptidase domain-containing protein [Verrucomicrobiae bacterium]
MKKFSLLLLTVCCACLIPDASSQRSRPTIPGPARTSTANPLEQLSSSLQSIAGEVKPAVVRILNFAYAIEDDRAHSGGAVVSQQRSSGSGILISSDGYIVTNAHVVQGARRLQVRLNEAVPNVDSHVLNAKLVGMDRQTDLAVIKIDLTGLPFLTFGDSSNLNQGQIVLAFGSPLGLENSVSMGVVSAVDRQLNPDDPLVFVQTDAAINPGNSGGPLVNTSGEVVGINTFILTKSGGSEGVGFAIPSNLVSAICRQIRTDHHVHHHQIGISVRAITPALVQALGLPTENGVLIEDVAPQSTADAAGLKVGDIIIRVHAKPIPNVRQLALNMYAYAAGDQAQIDVLRGRQKISFNVPVVERADDPQRFEDLVTEQDNSFARLGILALTVDEKVSALLPPLRVSGGVLVAAKMASGSSHFGDELAAGDIIHEVNGGEIKDAVSLRRSLDALSGDSPLVIQVERSGTLQFVVFENE